MPLDFFQIDEGTAILVIGILALLAMIITVFKNYIAGIIWGISILLLIWSGAFGLPMDYFWISTVLTSLLVISGFVVRGIV